MNCRALTLLLATVVFGLPAFASARANDRSKLIALLYEQVRSCYILPIKALGAEPVVVEVRLTPDGALEREPEVISGSPGSVNAQAAIRALNKCAPFQIPREWASRYRDWKVLRIQFNTVR